MNYLRCGPSCSRWLPGRRVRRVVRSCCSSEQRWQRFGSPLASEAQYWLVSLYPTTESCLSCKGRSLTAATRRSLPRLFLMDHLVATCALCCCCLRQRSGRRTAGASCPCSGNSLCTIVSNVAGPGGTSRQVSDHEMILMF